MKPFSALVGLVTSALALGLLVFLASNQWIELYNTIPFFNVCIIILILEAGVIATEAHIDSASKELVVDSIIVVAVSICTVLYYYYFDGGYIFTGRYNYYDLLLKLCIPAFIVDVFAALNGAEFVSSLVAKKKIEKVG